MLKETEKRREDWLESRGGSSDYRSLRKQWCRLWGAKLPEKMKNFAWTLSHNSIPTEGVRHQRHMVELEACPICIAAVDSWKHALVECQMAKCVWSMVDVELVEHMVTITSEDARLWLVELQSTVNEEQFIKAIITL